MATVVVLSLIAGACGGDDDGGVTGTTGAGAAGPTTAADDVDPDGVLRIGLNLTQLALDPATLTSYADIMTNALYGSMLLRKGDGTYDPGFAEEASIVDPSTIEVTLRQGLTFSDGTPLDAEAVKFNLERNTTLKNPWLRQEILTALASVEVVDAVTARIHLQRPVSGAWYPLLADPETTLVSPTAVRDGVDFETEPVGAGPFLLESAAAEKGVVMKRNPDYFGADEVRLAGVEFVHAAPGPSVANALRANEVDFAPLSPELATGLNEPITVERLPHAGIQLIFMCKANPPLNDKRVRQALLYAMDREAIGQRIYGDDAQVANALRRPDDRYHDSTFDDRYDHDVDRAKELLAEAGNPNGFDIGMYISPGDSTVIGELLQAQWAEAGIKLSLQSSANVFQDFFLDHKLPLFPAPNTRLGLDAFTILLLPGATANVCAYENPDVTAALQDAMAADPDSDEAVDAWHRLSALVMDDLPFLPLAFHLEVVGYNADRLGGLEYWVNDYGNHFPRLDRVYIRA